jgi:flagellar biosynthetic protein FliQ
MTPDIAVDLMVEALQLVMLLAAVLVLPGLLTGVIVAVFQAATSINEQTLSFIPKLVGVFIALVLAGPWMLTVMTDYMRNVFTGIPGLIG